MKNFDKYIKSYLFYIISSFGISLTIKANIGVSSFNSMNLAIANASSIKVGTITIIFNILFLLIYMVMTKFKEPKKYAIQAFSVFMFGSFINFFTYGVLAGLSPSSYLLQLLLITIGTTIGGLSVGMIVGYDVITFPIESLCLLLSEITKHTFVRLRYFVDILSITVSIIVSLSYGLPLYVREGTLLSLLILSSAMNFSKNLHSRFLKNA